MPYITMTTLHDWNSHQLRVFRRYCRRFAVATTPDSMLRLGARYADKHAAERPLPRAHAAPARSGRAMRGEPEMTIR
jgi:hypothetical protein